jgi:hypothetical protein
MNAVTLLKNDHSKVKGLFEQFVAVGSAETLRESHQGALDPCVD